VNPTFSYGKGATVVYKYGRLDLKNLNLKIGTNKNLEPQEALSPAPQIIIKKLF
jgi:hypothetical protein